MATIQTIEEMPRVQIGSRVRLETEHRIRELERRQKPTPQDLRELADLRELLKIPTPEPRTRVSTKSRVAKSSHRRAVSLGGVHRDPDRHYAVLSKICEAYRALGEVALLDEAPKPHDVARRPSARPLNRLLHVEWETYSTWLTTILSRAHSRVTIWRNTHMTTKPRSRKPAAKAAVPGEFASLPYDGARASIPKLIARPRFLEADWHITRRSAPRLGRKPLLKSCIGRSAPRLYHGSSKLFRMISTTLWRCSNSPRRGRNPRHPLAASIGP